MTIDLDALSDETLAFLSEYHLATLTTLRADGSPHVVAVGFSYDVEAQAWHGSSRGRHRRRRSMPGRMEAAGQHAAVSQVDGGRWLRLEGPVRLVTDPDGVRAGVEGYAARYRDPAERDDRVVIEIEVDRILGRA